MYNIWIIAVFYICGELAIDDIPETSDKVIARGSNKSMLYSLIHIPLLKSKYSLNWANFAGCCNKSREWGYVTCFVFPLQVQRGGLCPGPVILTAGLTGSIYSHCSHTHNTQVIILHPVQNTITTVIECFWDIHLLLGGCGGLLVIEQYSVLMVPCREIIGYTILFVMDNKKFAY